jgi:DMSO/TMAO reductase YedYZ molybdopterin-dependent catalytic subunit
MVLFLHSKEVKKTRRTRLLAVLLVSAFIVLFGAISFNRLIEQFGSNVTSNTEQVADTNSGWSLTIDGLVQNPSNLSFSELTALPKSLVNAELHCVDAPSVSIAQGNWTGVRLGLILANAGVSPDAVKIAFYAKDGYTTDLTLTTAMREDIIVAYERDGTPLREQLRLVVPGAWGYKWISGLNHIELVNYDFKGYYESQGFSDEAKIPTGQP